MFIIRLLFVALLFAEALAFVILFLPFGIAAFAQMAKAKQPSASEARLALSPARGIVRWHVAAAVLVVVAVLVFGANYACELPERGWCELSADGTTRIANLALLEATGWIVTIGTLFGLAYAVRLHRQWVHVAELIGFGVCLLSPTMLMLASFESASDPMLLAACGLAGLVLYCAGLFPPSKLAKSAALATSCVIMSFAVTDLVGPSNPIWLLFVIAAGFAVFRIEWKRVLATMPATVAEMAPVDRDDVTPSLMERMSGAITTRAVTFVVVNVACCSFLILVTTMEFGTDEPIRAATFAAIALGVATIGAVLTLYAPKWFGLKRSGVDHAAATFVVLMAAAAVMHLFATGPVYSDFQGTSGFVQLWKPILAGFAVIGALTIVLTTLTGRERQIRPLMVALVLPAAFLLPDSAFFTFTRGDSAVVWAQRILETGITIAMLAVMWYAFGPGHRDRARYVKQRKGEPMAELMAHK